MATAEVMLFGMGIAFVLGTLFMLWGFEDERPHFKSIFHLFASMFFYSLAQLFLMEYAETTAVLIFNLMFYGFAMINFLMFVIYGTASLGAYHKRRKYGPEQEEWE